MPPADVLSELRNRISKDVTVILAEEPSRDSRTLRVQNFIRDGRSFIPFFDSPAMLRAAGAPTDRPIYEIDRRLLVSILRGDELLVWNPGLPSELMASASDLKRAFPEPLESGQSMESIGNHKWQVTEPTPIRIGMPESPPRVETISALRNAVSTTGVSLVYWFWVSINGDPPHLGLAVAPDDDAVVARVGAAIDPIWRRASPENTTFDILRFGDAALDATIRDTGRLLYRG